MKNIVRTMKLGTLTIAIIAISVFYFLHYSKATPRRNLVKTKNPQLRTIAHVVHAQGSLEAHGYAKVGPLITGTVKRILVATDQKVKKGELLAILDNGKGGDTVLRQQEAVLEKAKASMQYQEAYFKRQQSLFNAGQLAKDTYEKALQDVSIIRAEVKNQQAALEKEKYLYNNTFIRSPCDGTILAVDVKEGETVSEVAAYPTVLFEIAQNLDIMFATLAIDENKIGSVALGQKVKIMVDTYPYRHWCTSIHHIANAPIQQQKTQNAPQTVRYEAHCSVSNPDGALKPGMTIHANIIAAKKKNVLSLPGFVFQVNMSLLKKVVKLAGYSFKPLDKIKRHDLHAKKPTKTIPQTVWILDDNTIIERIVYTGITNNAYFEIVSGLQPNDAVVFDIGSYDEMKKWYAQWAGKGL